MYEINMPNKKKLNRAIRKKNNRKMPFTHFTIVK